MGFCKIQGIVKVRVKPFYKYRFYSGCMKVLYIPCENKECRGSKRKPPPVILNFLFYLVEITNEDNTGFIELPIIEVGKWVTRRTPFGD